MPENPKPKRTYLSARRRSQASQTRRMILEAARKLFDERGYASATIDAIAQEAGVSPETIYAAFGSKQGILRRLVDVTVVGDEEPVPLLERSFVRETINETDPRRMIAKFARDMYQIMRRMSPIFLLLRTTAKADPEIAALREHVLKDRLQGMAFFIHHLRRVAPGRAEPDQDAATVWAVSSAEVFDLLTRDLGWTEEQYVAWLSDSLERLLLGDTL